MVKAGTEKSTNSPSQIKNCRVVLFLSSKISSKQNSKFANPVRLIRNCISSDAGKSSSATCNKITTGRRKSRTTFYSHCSNISLKFLNRARTLKNWKHWTGEHNDRSFVLSFYNTALHHLCVTHSQKPKSKTTIWWGAKLKMVSFLVF